MQYLRHTYSNQLSLIRNSNLAEHSVVHLVTPFPSDSRACPHVMSSFTKKDSGEQAT